MTWQIMSDKRYLIVILLLVLNVPVIAQVKETGGLCSCNVPVQIWRDSILKRIDNIVNSVFRDSLQVKADKLEAVALQSPGVSVKTGMFADHYLEYNAAFTTRIEGEYNYNNLFQQTLNYRTTATMLKKLPFKVMLSARKTNSHWFRDYVDFSVGLNGKDLTKRASLANLKNHRASNLALVDKLKLLYRNRIDQLQKLDNGLDHQMEDSCINTYIKYKEIIANREYYLDSLQNIAGGNDKLLEEAERYVKWYDSSKSQIDAFIERISGLENDYKIALQQFDKAVSNATTGAVDAELPGILKQYGKGLANLDTTTLLPDYSKLQRIQRFSIGRSMPSGTQLNLQNISIKGLDIEYQSDHYFYALTAGWTDFGLRDFVFQTGSRKVNHFVYSAGVGRGERASNFIFVNVFGGSKSQDLTSSQVGQVTHSVVGLSLSSQIRLDSWLVNAEVSQSSFEKQTNGTSKRSFSFSDKTNKAYSLTAKGSVRDANLHFTGYYKHFGVNYYGFNAYRLIANNDLWGADVSKQLLNNALSIKVAIKKNDYQNPLVQQVYAGKNIITTVNAVLNKKQFTVSAGYIPSYQYVGINDSVYESRYEVINCLVNVRYKTGEIPSSTVVIFNRFLNSKPSNRFFYGSSTNIVLNQLFLFPVYSTSLNISVFKNSIYRYIVCDGSIQYQVSRTVTVKGGFKINSLSTDIYEAKAGAYGGTTINVPRVGLFTLRLDSQYYPDINYRLYSSTMGSIGFSTHFK